MSFHRVVFVAVATLLSIGMTSIASAGCCDGGYSAPVYATVAPVVATAAAAPAGRRRRLRSMRCRSRPQCRLPLWSQPSCPAGSAARAAAGTAAAIAAGRAGAAAGKGGGGVRQLRRLRRLWWRLRWLRTVGRLRGAFALCGQSGSGLFRPGHHDAVSDLFAGDGLRGRDGLSLRAGLRLRLRLWRRAAQRAVLSASLLSSALCLSHADGDASLYASALLRRPALAALSVMRAGVR